MNRLRSPAYWPALLSLTLALASCTHTIKPAKQPFTGYAPQPPFRSAIRRLCRRGRAVSGPAVLLILVGLLCLLLLSGCTTTSAVVAGSRAAVGSLNVREPIMLLPPKLTYERIQNEQPLDGAEFQASAVVASLLAAARQSLQQKGLAVIGEVSAGNAEVRHPLEGLSARADALFHSPIDPSLVEQLRQVQPAGEDRAVLVQYVRVKVGPGGFWDPNTGVIHSKMSSANLRAAILRCRDGQLLWRNEVFLREVPRVNSSKFRKAVQLLYQP